jgi:uncharacterized protein DUF6458
MGIGVSVFLIAIGAILAFAVNVATTGIDLDVVGVILMLVGGAGLLFSLLWWNEAMPWRRDQTVIRERYVEPLDGHREEIVERPVTRERRVIERQERTY